MASNRKLGRTSDHRRAMLRAMVTFLLENGRIETTLARAKEVAPMCENLASATHWQPAARRWHTSPKKQLLPSCFLKLRRNTRHATVATPALSRQVHAAATVQKWQLLNLFKDGSK